MDDPMFRVPAPGVSVITIFLDGERFIGEAVESVLAQTYPSWELLLVDDGSTDGSTTIARRYAERYRGRVRYLEHAGHRNRGMSASRNLGLQNARGTYVAFLDVDDVYLPHKLAHQVPILDANPPVGLVYGAMGLWYGWTGRPEDLARDRVRELGVPARTVMDGSALLAQCLRGRVHPPGTCDVLVRREVLEAAGGFEESFRGLYEDQVFFYKTCLRAPVVADERCGARYRRHPDSCCRRDSAVRHSAGRRRPNPAYLRFLDWLARYLVEQRIAERELWKALRREMWLERHPNCRHALDLGRRRWTALRQAVAGAGDGARRVR